MKRLALAAGALLLAGCGNATHTTTSTVTVTQTVTVQPSVPPTVAHTALPPTGPKTVIDSFGLYETVIDNNGTYLIGADISAGKYHTLGGATCYWARLRSLDTKDIIDSHKGSGPQVIEIRESDIAFLTQNCGTWQMVPWF